MKKTQNPTLPSKERIREFLATSKAMGLIIRLVCDDSGVYLTLWTNKLKFLATLDKNLFEELWKTQQYTIFHTYRDISDNFRSYIGHKAYWNESEINKLKIRCLLIGNQGDIT